MTIQITRHAYERLKERTGFSPQRSAEIAEKAYYCGKAAEDFPKIVQNYLTNVLEGSSGDYLRVLGNDIYIFGNGYLITVFSIPNKIINKLNNRRKIKCAL